MPNAALAYCAAPGCSTRVSGRYCAAHATDVRRHERRHYAGPLSYGRAWRRRRRTPFLARNPLCVECQAEGKNVLAEEVDHIIPHQGDAELFWSWENLQALCKAHHSRKTIRESKGQSR